LKSGLWWDITWNSVWGCLNDCGYCYARKMAYRLSFVKNLMECFQTKLVGNPELDIMDLRKFKPTWIEWNFNRAFPKKPSKILVNSMSDIKFWQPEWMCKVIGRIVDSPQHTFQILTKFPEIYAKYKFPANCWLGVTVTSNDDIEKAYKLENMDIPNLKFISVEPILDNWVLMIPTINLISDWIILGLETNNRNTFVPDLDKIEALVYDAKLSGIPIFMKNSMLKCWDKPLIQEFPNEQK